MPYPGIELSVFHLQRAFPLHFHDALVVAVVVAGEEGLCVNDVWHRAGPGTAVVLEPNRAHANAPTGNAGAVYRTFYVSGHLLTHPGARPARLRTHVVTDPRVVRQLRDLHEALDAPTASGRDEVVATLSAVVRDVAEPHAEPEPPEAVLAAATILRDRCADPLRWPAVARQVGYSSAYLARTFRRHLGVPPHAYQLQYRLALAKRLLRGRCTLAAVAHAAGFVDQSHLNRCFRTYVGESPARFRAQRTQAGAALGSAARGTR